MSNHYVYLLINPLDNMMYIGKRSCDCSPEEDTSYMSSSKYVPKDLCDKLILEEFSTAKEAIEYEIYLHNHFDVANNKQFYNKAKQTSTGFDTTGTTLTKEHRQKCSQALKGRAVSIEHANKISKSLSGHVQTKEHRDNNSKAQKALYDKGYINPRQGVVMDDELKTKISQRKKELQCDAGTNNNRFSPWFIKTADGTITKYYNTTKEEQSVKDGYSKGRYQDLSTKSKGTNPIKRGPFKGCIIGNIVEDIVSSI